MKKSFTALSLAALLSLSLTACQTGHTEPVSGTTETADTAAPEQDTADGNTESDSSETSNEPASEIPSDADTPDSDPASDGPVPLSVSLRTTYLNELQDQTLISRTLFDTITLSPQDSDTFSSLADALQKKLSSPQAEASHKTHTQNAEIAARDFLDHPDHFWGPYTSEASLSVRRADSIALSVLKQDVEFTGGAHPISFYSGATFDSQSGEQLHLSDVVTDLSALPGILEPMLKAKYPNTSFFSLTDDLKSASEKGDDGFSWTLDPQGVTFYFSPYVLASYADGLLTATIPFAGYPELFSEAYTVVPEDYTLFFQPWYPLSYDLDSDGDMEEITISGETDPNGTYTTLSVEVDQSSYDFEIYSFALNPYLVHTADGHNYLYLKTTVENDWQQLLVYDLNKDLVSEIGYTEGDSFYDSYSADNSMVRELPTNPNRFRLSTRMNLLSTAYGERFYKIGADGMPEPQSDTYQVTSDIRLTTLQELSAAIVDPQNGAVLDAQAIIPKGETLRLYRTDKVSYMDLLMEDGRICRVEVDTSDWPQTVNGQSIEDCFDGTQFAG